MSMSNYLESKVLNHICGKSNYTAPPVLYAGLLTELIDGEEGQATEIAEASYERAGISFGVAENGVIENDTDVNFAVAKEVWGVVKAVAIYDAKTNGNMLFYTNLETEQNVIVDNQLIFKTGKLTITLD